MLSTSARLLRLASLLQSRGHWPGPALAAELAVDPRTLRRDVERLRELGYPVQASAGVGGGYALGRGAELPPLMLDDDEAVALAIALRVASASIGGLDDTVPRLLSKLDQLMPSRLRRRASALHAVTLSLRVGEPLADAGRLAELATACRDRRLLSFSYRAHDGSASRREIEPLRIAHYGRRWYLIGWDCTREDWRTFRIDRIDGRLGLGAARPPRTPPADVVTRIELGIAHAPFAYRLSLRLAGTITELAPHIPNWVGILEADGGTHCLLRLGADSVETLLAQVAMVGRPTQLVEGQALLPQLGAVLQRVQASLLAEPLPTPGRDGRPRRRR